MNLLNNSDCDWTGKEFWFDDNGQAHRQDLHYGEDYTLESGSLIDDIESIANGYIIDEDGYDYE